MNSMHSTYKINKSTASNGVYVAKPFDVKKNFANLTKIDVKFKSESSEHFTNGGSKTTNETTYVEIQEPQKTSLKKSPSFNSSLKSMPASIHNNNVNNVENNRPTNYKEYIEYINNKMIANSQETNATSANVTSN